MVTPVPAVRTIEPSFVILIASAAPFLIVDVRSGVVFLVLTSSARALVAAVARASSAVEASRKRDISIPSGPYSPLRRTPPLPALKNFGHNVFVQPGPPFVSIEYDISEERRVGIACVRMWSSWFTL